MRRSRGQVLVRVLALLIVSGMLVCAMEGPDHQQEAHHCVTCCLGHHAPAPLQDTAQPPLVIVGILAAPYWLGLSQTSLSPQVPPPKLPL